MVDKNITTLISVPSGFDLLQEKLRLNCTYQALADKYQCSQENIIQKIRRVTNTVNPDLAEQYQRSPAPILKAMEAMHVIESANPEKVKKMSGVQNAVAGKILWEMRHGEEAKLNPESNYTELEIEYKDLKIKLSNINKVESKPLNVIDITLDNDDSQPPLK